MKPYLLKKKNAAGSSLIRSILILALLLISVITHAQKSTQKKGYVSVNGIQMYYEIHGTGAPLLLIHGGLGSTGMFDSILPTLTARRQVITVDLYGHGRTVLTGRLTSVPDMANDVAALLQKLAFNKVDVLGYSLGGSVAIRLAIQHPDMIRKLVVVSAGFARNGFYPEILGMQEQMGAGAVDFIKKTPIYNAYIAIAPKPDDFPKLLEVNANMMRQDYDWSEEVKRLNMPVMLLYGDADMIRPEHIVQFYHLLGGGLKDAGWNREHMSKNRLAILPNLTHYEMFNAPEMIRTVIPFLDNDMH